MGQAKRRKAEIQALKNQPPVVDLTQTVKLYHFTDLLISERPLGVVTPEGLMPMGTAIVNIAIIPRGKDFPSDAWMTGYGMSYMSKVLSGTPRENECLTNAFLDGDESGDMLQISWTRTANAPANVESHILTCAIASLDQDLRRRWTNRPVKFESGRSPMKLGFAQA